MPDKDTSCVVVCALSVNLSVAERELFDFGLNATLTVQCAPCASELPQPFPVITNSVGFEPVSVIPLIVNAPVPELVNVTVFAPLVVFMLWFEKLRLDGLTLAFGAIPVAVTCTCCGLPEALSWKLSTAEMLPVLLGRRLSVTWQVLPPASELPQLLLC